MFHTMIYRVEPRSVTGGLIGPYSARISALNSPKEERLAKRLNCDLN
jgi:hypothetical protein